MSILTKPMRALFAAGLVVAALVAPSCSNGSSESSAPAYLSGAIAFGVPHRATTPAAQVRAIDEEGVVVATADLNPGGDFTLVASTWDGFVGRIEADVVWQLPGDDPVTLRTARDVVVADAVPTFWWISPVTTLASRLRSRRPDFTREGADGLARLHLGLSVTARDPVFAETYRAPAAWSRVLGARGSSTLDEWFETLTTEAVAGAPARSFRIPHPYPKLRELLYASQATAQARGASQDGNAFASWKLFGTAVATDYRVIGGSLLWGYGIEAAGSGSVSTVDLMLEIQAIQRELQALSTLNTQSAIQDAWSYTVGSVAAPAVATIQEINDRYLQYMSPVGDPPPPQQPVQAAAYLQTNFERLTNALASLRSALAGGPLAPFGPLGSIYARNISLMRCGVEASAAEDARWLSMQFRDNELLDQARVATDMYCGWLMLGANLLGEWAHLNPSTFPQSLAGNENTVQGKIALAQAILFGDATQPGINATILQAQQLIPPAIIASELAVVDCGWNGRGLGEEIGTIYYKGVWRFGRYAATSSFAPALPPFIGWQYASLEELQRLRGRAYRVNPGSPRAGLVTLGWPESVLSGPSPLQFGYINSDGNGRFYNWDEDKPNDGVWDNNDLANLITTALSPYGTGSQLNDPGTAFATGRFATSLSLDAASNVTVDVATVVAASGGSVSKSTGTLGPVITPYGYDPTNPNSPVVPINVGDYASWTSSDTTALLATNLPGVVDDLRSRLIWRNSALGAGGYTAQATLVQSLTLSAALLGSMPLRASTHPVPVDATFDPIRLNTIRVTPEGITYDQLSYNQSPVVYCYATGYYVSQSSYGTAEPDGAALRDFTNSSATVGTVQWSVSSPSGLAFFFPGTNMLRLNLGQGVEDVIITHQITPPGGVPITTTTVIHVTF